MHEKDGQKKTVSSCEQSSTGYGIRRKISKSTTSCDGANAGGGRRRKRGYGGIRRTATYVELSCIRMIKGASGNFFHLLHAGF